MRTNISEVTRGSFAHYFILNDEEIVFLVFVVISLQK
ncbi:MAG: hypothetical protein ACI89Z_001474 [Porticoccus sp.]|jgi:hypothetical protein